MVEKKLNLTQPILSVRRYSKKVDQRTTENASLSPNRTEVISGPVRHPGAVPFRWERAPGQPKEQIKQQTRNRDASGEAGDRDEAFVDELDDLLSVTESFVSSCCSMDDIDAESSRRFFLDPQPREFTMGSSVREQSKEVREDKPAFWYRTSFAKSYSGNKEKRENDCNRHENSITVGCLLPQCCVKSSMCIVNPVPVMSLRTRLAFVPDRRMQSGTSSENEDEVITWEGKWKWSWIESRKLPETMILAKDPQVHAAFSRQIPVCGEFRAQSAISWTVEDLIANSDFSFEQEIMKPAVIKQTEESKENKMGLMEERARSKSPHALTYCDVPLSFINDHKKRFKTLQELLANEDSQKELESRICAKKTVCVDTVDNMRSCSPNSILPGSREREEDLHLGCISAAEKKLAKNVEKQLTRAKTLHLKIPKFPAPPPLPKSPTDSWLFRTLPSMSTRNASSLPFISRCSNRN